MLGEMGQLPFGKKLNFGDQFEVLAGDCNILEYTITANAFAWTWKTR